MRPLKLNFSHRVDHERSSPPQHGMNGGQDVLFLPSSSIWSVQKSCIHRLAGSWSGAAQELPAAESSIMAPPPTIKRPLQLVPSLAASHSTTTTSSSTSSTVATTASTSSSAASGSNAALSPVPLVDHGTEVSSSSSSSLSSSPLLVLEGLLALAKDQRYQRECQSLVCDALSDARRTRRRRPGDTTRTRNNTTATSTSTTTDRNDSLHHLLPTDSDGPTVTAQLVSVVAASLWTTWIVWRYGKTLGMDSCGLDYAVSGTTSLQQQQWKVRSATILSVIAQCCCLFLGGNALSTDGGRSQPSSAAADADRAAADADLRGSRRRQFHEARRRAMMERATLSAAADAASMQQNRLPEDRVPSRQERRRHPQPPLPSEGRHHRGDVRNIPDATRSRLMASLRDMVGRVTRSMILTSGPPPALGPHDVSDPNPPNASLTTFTVATWLLRLHLAFYCLQGQFPSWFHRVFRLTFHNNRDALVPRPSSQTTRLVGLFILAQALGASVPALARLLFRNGWFARWWGQREPPVASASAAAQSHWKQLLAAEHCSAPAVAASPSSPSPPACLICRQPRVRPACPPCGHVFCWTCLHQWLAERPRQHCPYCRTQCQPQQVLALHHY